MPTQGPKDTPFLAGLILGLAKIYKQATDKEAEPGWYNDNYNGQLYGEFARFVQDVLDKIDKSLSYNSRSLVKFLKKVLPPKA